MKILLKFILIYNLFFYQLTIASNDMRLIDFDDNCIANILSCIDNPKDIIHCEAVSKRLRKIILDYHLKEIVLDNYFISLDQTDQFRILNIYVNSAGTAHSLDNFSSETQELYYDQFININYSQIIPSLKKVEVDINDRPAALLLQFYENLRENNTFGYTQFKKKARLLFGLILYSIDQYDIQDQASLQNILIKIKQSLPFNCEQLKEVFSPIFKLKIQERLALSQIDQQILEKKALRGSIYKFNPFGSSSIQSTDTDLGISLADTVGRIFQVLYDQDDNEFVSPVGSAMMTKLINGKPDTVVQDDLLNGVITAAHVISNRSIFETIKGLYFVSHTSLNKDTGLPKKISRDTGSFEEINTEQELIEFLENNDNSYELQQFNIRRVTTQSERLFTNNKTKASKPQYRNHEDIVFCAFKNKTYQHLYDIRIEYPFIKDRANTQYFECHEHYVAGYPGCFHYDKELLPGKIRNDLLDKSDFAIAPLIITKGEGHITVRDRCLVIKAPTSKGMSGGPAFTVELRGEFIKDRKGKVIVTRRDEEVSVTIKIIPVIKFIGSISTVNDFGENVCCG